MMGARPRETVPKYNYSPDWMTVMDESNLSYDLFYHHSGLHHTSIGHSVIGFL